MACQLPECLVGGKDKRYAERSYEGRIHFTHHVHTHQFCRSKSNISTNTRLGILCPPTPELIVS